ncbi:hypothetical protein MBBA_1328 [Methanoculleus bourgensis]|nr:hypothetical protein MBBA_1328 [Methanoculleus bourgensis]
MARLVYAIPLLFFLIPGYLTAILLLPFSDREFIGIAFDSGGVATGPMAVTFLLSLAVGVAAGIEGRNPVTDGFGLIALIALAPILSVLALGILYRRTGGEVPILAFKAMSILFSVRRHIPPCREISPGSTGSRR